ncbi:MAG: efflux RND transporter permease subunit [bacterium]
MGEQYINHILRRRWWVLLFTLIVVFFLMSGGRFLKFDNDYRIFFDGTNPQLLAFEELQSTYTKNDNALLVLAPKNGNVFTPETLNAVVDITERAWQVPYSLRVDSLSNYQHTYAEGDDLTVIDLVENPKDLTTEQLSYIRDVALNEPLLVKRLVSESGHVTAINITLELPGKDATAENPKAVAKIREIEQYVRDTYPELDVYLSGIVMMNNAFPEASQYDMQHLIPLAVLVILAMVFLLLRHVMGTFVTFLVIVFSVMAAMGSAGWLGIHLSPPVMTAPIIILTLAIADCVHILSNWLQGMRQGLDKHTAMAESLRINLAPVFLTSLTTAIGFLSLNFSDVPPFRDLGNISALGVMFAWLFSMTLLPALVTLLPTLPSFSKKEPQSIADKAAKKAMMDKLADFVIAQQKRLIWIMGAVILVLIAFIPKNELNDVFVKYFDERIQFRTDTDFIVENLTGVYFVDYSLNAKEDNGVSAPQFQQDVETFTNWLRDQPEVLHVNTYTDIMKRLNRNMHADDNAWYRLPDQRDLAAQYLLLYEMSLPYGLDLNNQIDIRKQSTRLSVTLETLSTEQILAFEQRVYAWMGENTPNLQTYGSSPTIMFAHIGEKNIRSMLIGTVLAFLMISLILMIALKSWRYGVLSLIPNLVPAAMAFGLWGIVDGEVGLSLSVVAAMTMGIVVDDTVHFLSKYLRAIREKALSATEAVRYAFNTVGSALWVTSAALVAGFMVISTSSFELNSGMGLLVSIVVIFALIADFFFLPPLLIKLHAWLHGESKTENNVPLNEKPITHSA